MLDLGVERAELLQLLKMKKCVSEMSRQGGKLYYKYWGEKTKRNKEPVDCMIICCLRKTG